MRDSGRKAMADQAERLLGGDPSASDCCAARPLVGELICVAAGYAINCVENLEKHLEQAWAAGATERQLVLTLSIAHGVKTAAAAKVDAAVQLAPGEAGAQNGCCEAKPADVGGVRPTSDLSPLGFTQAGQSLAAGGACSCSAPAE